MLVCPVCRTGIEVYACACGALVDRLGWSPRCITFQERPDRGGRVASVLRDGRILVRRRRRGAQEPGTGEEALGALEAVLPGMRLAWLAREVLRS